MASGDAGLPQTHMMGRGLQTHLKCSGAGMCYTSRMRRPTLIATVFALTLAHPAAAEGGKPEMLKAGDRAPAIRCFDQDGNPVDLGERFASGTTLVWFYPKANTSG